MFKVEYVWIGGHGELRSKTKVVKKVTNDLQLSDLSEWNYDGSSTDQALGADSEVMIRPCAIYRDPFRGQNDKIVLCDTWLPNGEPHPTNTRHSANKLLEAKKEEEPMFGIEQEFFMIDRKTGRALGWPDDHRYQMGEQGPFYCSVGAGNAYGRDYLEEVLDHCVTMDIGVTGLNMEVAPAQAELQICATGIAAADEIYMLRYILERTGEKYDIGLDLTPKPVEGDVNGSGAHCNFSTKAMRENDNGYELILQAIDKLKNKHAEHIAVYGSGNEKRLTGKHETASIDDFSFGVANRGASIRIPRSTEADGKGYFEDRRPASSCDPYLVIGKIFETVME